MSRVGEAHRATGETDVRVRVDLDGAGDSTISTGVGFFDHMLTLLARHSLIDLVIEAKGDLETGSHHTVEDVGITLGQALTAALGDKAGIERYGSALIPMDECLVQAAIDISGRPVAALDVPLPTAVIGGFETELLEEFVRGLANHAGLTVHLRLLVPGNAHHVIEGCFKALARALGQAVAPNPRVSGVPFDQGKPVSSVVAVLDYEMSNLRSATKALERLGANVRVVRDPAGAAGADAVVLPGVGNFGEAMRRIRAAGLDRVVLDAADRGVPVLGICLGLQLLFDESEESPGAAGLGLLPGAVRRLRTDRKLPHIGWSRVRWRPGCVLAPEDDHHAESTYYFVHTYGCEPEDDALVLGRADHGVEFCAAAGRDGLTGVQFHPEKSSAAGLGLLGRWLVAAGVVADPVASPS